MNKYLAFCLLLISINSGFSQSSTTQEAENSIGLRMGYNQGYLKDLNFSPLNYREGGLLYVLTYANKNSKENGLLNVDIEFSPSQLKTSASHYFTSQLTMANVDVSYVRKLKTKEKLVVYLGGQYSSYLHIADWEDFDTFSFLASHGVGLKGILTYEIKAKHSLSTSLFIPVFQFLVRPPYNGIDEEIIENQDKIGSIIFSGDPSSFGRYLAFDWQLNYQFELTSKFNLAASYLLRYQHVSEVNELTHLQNQLTVGLNFKF